MRNGARRWIRFTTCAALAAHIALGAAAVANGATTYIAGESLTSGDVVTFNASGDVIRTTSASDVVIGVVFQAAANGNPVAVETTDDITVNAAASTAALRYLNPSSTAGVAVGSATPTSTTFGYSRTAESGGTLSMQFLRAGGGSGGSTTFQEDDAGAGTFTTLDLQAGLDGSLAGGELDVSVDIDEVAGVPLSELAFFAPFDNKQTLAPTLLLGNGDYLAAAESNVGWFINYRYNGDRHDDGTSGFDFADGTALPNGIKGGAGPTGQALDLADATSGYRMTGTPTFPFGVLGANDAFIVVLTFNELSTSETDQDFYFRSAGGTPTRGLWLMGDDSGTPGGTIFFSEYDDGTPEFVSASSNVKDGNDHIVVMVSEGANIRLWVDGTLEATTTHTRVAWDWGSTTSDFFQFDTTTRALDTEGKVGSLMMFQGGATSHGDFGEFLSGLSASDDSSELRGSRYMSGKFGEGRLYLGKDFEAYSSEAFRPLRASGTISLWVRPVFDAADVDNDLAATGEDPVFWQMDTDGTDGWILYYDVSAARWVFQITAGGTVFTAQSAVQTFADEDFGGAGEPWGIHLTATWDAATARMRLYVDGTQAQETALTGELLPTGELVTNMTIGNEPAPAKSRAANAVLDHMKADNREWSATDVAHDAAAIRPF